MASATQSMDDSCGVIVDMLSFAQMSAGKTFRKERHLILVQRDDGIIVIQYKKNTRTKALLKKLREMCVASGYEEEVINNFLYHLGKTHPLNHHALYLMLPLPSVFPWPLPVPLHTKSHLTELWNEVEMRSALAEALFRSKEVAEAHFGVRIDGTTLLTCKTTHSQ